MDYFELLKDLGVDLIWIAVCSVLVGAWAPKWPAGWLAMDGQLLRLKSFETSDFYRKFNLHHWAKILPEAGSTFGGRSKREMPKANRDEIQSYLVELRRAEWVHWLANIAVVGIWLSGSIWISIPMTIGTLLINGIFIAILRSNRLRGLRAIERLGRD